MSELNSKFSDEAMQAFLTDSVEQDDENKMFEAVRRQVAEEFSDVLAEHGYTPLDEDLDRYDKVRHIIEHDLIDEVREKHGSIPESEEFTDAIKRWATTRLMELDNVEKYLIDYAVSYGYLIQIRSQLGEHDEAVKFAISASDDKRRIFANIIIQHRVRADNPALVAMVAFLPGGDVSVDDESMASYMTAAMADVPGFEERTKEIARIHHRIYEVIGFHLEDEAGPVKVSETEQEVAHLVQKGYLYEYKSLAWREAYLYEYAQEHCPSLTPQNVHDIVAVINEEYPAGK